MDWRATRFDWNRARAFLVTAEEGSLSAAARALGMAQPTLSRQVAALEAELGVTLFDRVGRRLVLSPAGEATVDAARRMGEAAAAFSRTAGGRAETVEGTIRLTASESVAAYTLPPILAALRIAEPGIQVELVAANSLSDLARREADIAIRSARPTDPDLIARKVGGGTARLYAARAYLDRAGPFDTPERLAQADFVGFDDNEDFRAGLAAIGVAVPAARFTLRTDNHLTQWQMVRAGIGVGVMIAAAGDVDPQVAPAAPWLPTFDYPIWLVAHRDLTTSRRVRRVFDWLAAALTQTV